MEATNIYGKLHEIQTQLKAPKNQFNSFGKYNYRSCEDILEAVKPLLNGLVLLLSDDIIQIGDRYYVKATATLTDGKDTISNPAHAREEADKKGMDASQLTGATSSYARKYALAGLFLLDDNKDADTQDNSKQDKKQDKSSEPKKEADKPNRTPDEMRQEMSDWFIKQYGSDAMLKFSEMTNGTFAAPDKIKTDKNVAICYDKYLQYKEGK